MDVTLPDIFLPPRIDWLWFYFINLLVFQPIKIIRTYDSVVVARFSLEDFALMAVLSGVLWVPILVGGPVWVSGLLAAVCMGYLWLDAASFQKSSIGAHWNALRFFFRHYRSFRTQFRKSFHQDSVMPWRAYYPLVLCLIYGVVFAYHGPGRAWILLCSCTLVLMCRLVTRWRKLTWRIVLVLGGVQCILWVFQASAVGLIVNLAWIKGQLALPGFCLFLLLRSLWGYCADQHGHHAPSHLRNWLPWNQRQHVKKSRCLKDMHGQALNLPALKTIPPSSQPSQHGKLAGQNVILITLESVGAAYLNGFSKVGKASNAETPWLDALAEQSWSSGDHYALSPNTNQSLFHLYQGCYAGPVSQTALHCLRDQGYQTHFVTSQNANQFEMRRLVEDLGFSDILDQSGMVESQNLGDGALLEGIQKLMPTLQERPYFIHILTAQTHQPYQSLHHRRHQDTQPHSSKARYLDAIEETDQLLADLFVQLGSCLDLENTLVIVTADHGQAFGQHGYQLHSNATLDVQTRCPLIISHPKLGAGQLDRSCHFDLMPTVLDLLGVAHQQMTMGGNVWDSQRTQDYLLYSKIRARGAPAHLSLVFGEEKLMLDRVLHRYLQGDVYEQDMQALSPAARRTALAQLYQLVHHYGLSKTPKDPYLQ